MSRIAIIPARGGSKRIPGKNIRSFAGKPILAYSIEAARASMLFDDVMVSTDDPHIAELAVKLGATVPFFRTKENADDHSTTVDVLLEVIGKYQEQNRFFETACCLYPTAPFTTPALLKQSFDQLQQGQFDTVFPVVQYDYPIQRSLQINENGLVQMVWPEFQRSRSQDLPPRFHDSGLFYWFRPEKLIEDKRLFCENSGAVIISALECHDIDSPEDWEIAELKYRRLNSSQKQ